MSKDIVVASTTDTQRDVDLAAGIPLEEAGKTAEPETPGADGDAEAEGRGKPAPGEEEPEGDKNEETPETPAAEGAAPPTEGEEGRQDKGKAKGRGKGWQERVDKLTKRTYELRDENDRLAEENRALREKSERGTAISPAPAATSVVDELPPEPDENKFLEEGKSYKEFLNALWDWREKKKEVETQRQKVEDSRRAEDERLRSNLNAHLERVEDAREKYPDWDEVMHQPIMIPKSVHAAIIEMENGPDVAYYLGQHPEVCEELVEMSSVRAVTRVGMIAASLEGQPSAPAKPAASSQPERKISSSAPPPIRPTTGTSTKSAVAVDELPYREYRKVRDAEEANRYK
jgi:hypothetical protein